MESSYPLLVELYNTGDFDLPISENDLNKIASLFSENENTNIELIEVVYVDEEKIVEINQEYLDRNYVTDIISFSYHGENESLEGTLYCCAPRIQEQAVELAEESKNEFARIFIHGLLHLAGYDDQSELEKLEMTDLENKYLSLSGY